MPAPHVKCGIIF